MTSSLESISLSQAYRALCCLDRRFEAMQIGGKSDGRMHFCFCLSRSQGLKVLGGEGGPGRYLLHLTSQHDFFSGEQVRPRAPRSRLFAREFRTDFAAVATPSTGGDLGEVPGGYRAWAQLEQHGTSKSELHKSIDFWGAGLRSFCELLVGTLRAEWDEVRPPFALVGRVLRLDIHRPACVRKLHV